MSCQHKSPNSTFIVKVTIKRDFLFSTNQHVCCGKAQPLAGCHQSYLILLDIDHFVSRVDQHIRQWELNNHSDHMSLL